MHCESDGLPISSSVEELDSQAVLCKVAIDVIL